MIVLIPVNNAFKHVSCRNSISNLIGQIPISRKRASVGTDLGVPLLSSVKSVVISEALHNSLSLDLINFHSCISA